MTTVKDYVDTFYNIHNKLITNYYHFRDRDAYKQYWTECSFEIRRMYISNKNLFLVALVIFIYKTNGALFIKDFKSLFDNATRKANHIFRLHGTALDDMIDAITG